VLKWVLLVLSAVFLIVTVAALIGYVVGIFREAQPQRMSGSGGKGKGKGKRKSRKKSR